jgi:hypothetical protein
LTIADVLRHEAGLADLNHTFTFAELAAIDTNAIGQILEDHAPSWPSETNRRQYHGVTRGWIINEIVRRADPLKRTVGVILQEDIVPKLDPGARLFIGLKVANAHAHDVVPMFNMDPAWAIVQSFVPPFLGRRVPWGPVWCLSHVWREIEKNVISRSNLPFEDPYKAAAGIKAGAAAAAPLVAALGSKDAVAKLPTEKASLIDDWNHPLLRSVEVPSANGHANAYSMALVASAIANSGESNGTLLSANGLAHAMGAPVVGHDSALETATKNTRAGWTIFDSDVVDNRQGFVGWQGYGGSCLQFHPDSDLRIGFGFAMNLAALDLGNAAYRNGYLHCELQQAVLDAAREAL